MNSGQFVNLYDKNYEKIFYNALGKDTPIYDIVMNVKNIDGQYTKMDGVTGTTLIPKATGEGSEYALDQIFMKNGKTFTPSTRKVRVRITQEAYEDDKTNSLSMVPMMLGESLGATTEQEVAYIFDRAQNGSYTGPDGKVLAATDHTFSDGSGNTWSNRPSTNSALTLTALEAAITNIKNTPNDRNIKLKLIPKILMVSQTDEIAARKILESKETLTQDKISNVVSTMGLRLVVNPYMNDTTRAWVLLTDKEYHQLMLVWRIKPTQKMDADINTDDVLYKCRSRFDSGWVDARGGYQSQAV